MLNCNPACQACHYKKLEYPDQIEKKEQWALKNLDRWKEVLQPIQPAPPDERLGYRSKTWMKISKTDSSLTQEGFPSQNLPMPSFGMERSVREDGRWKKEFISWDHCPLHTLAIQEMVQRFRLLLSQKAHHLIREPLVGIWFGRPHCVLVSKTPLAEGLDALPWETILEPPFDRVWSHCHSQVGKKIFGHLPIHPIFGPPAGAIHPIRAFRQVAQTLLLKARAQAVEALLAERPEWVLDLYCGTGDLSLLLPPTVGWMGIEQSSAAVEFANGLRSPAVSRQLAFVGSVEQRLADPKCLEKIQGHWSLYINPPRSGLTGVAKERLFGVIERSPPSRVVYLSCSASSLSRDLDAFEEQGYRITHLQPYDFFPQTEHFETLAILVRQRI